MFVPIRDAPSGHSTEETQAYYEWLWSNYFARVPVPRTEILWSGLYWITLFGVILIGGFFLYSWYFQRLHRARGELYGVVSFAGSILERIGRVATFNIAVWTVIVLWALWVLVTHILYGQVY